MSNIVLVESSTVLPPTLGVHQQPSFYNLRLYEDISPADVRTCGLLERVSSTLIMFERSLGNRNQPSKTRLAFFSAATFFLFSARRETFTSSY